MRISLILAICGNPTKDTQKISLVLEIISPFRVLSFLKVIKAAIFFIFTGCQDKSDSAQMRVVSFSLNKHDLVVIRNNQLFARRLVVADKFHSSSLEEGGVFITLCLVFFQMIYRVRI